MTATARSIVALLAALGLTWLVAHLVQERRVYREGPVVIGAVVDFDEVRSTSRNKNGRRTRGITRYPIVRYAIPAAWPEEAGQKVDYRFNAVDPSNQHLALGAEVQLRLSTENPRDATANSLLGVWLVPAFVLFFGCGVVLIPTLLVPTPKQPQRERRISGKATAGTRGKIGAVVVLVLFAAFWLYPPVMTLVLGPLFLLISAVAMLGCALGLLRRLGRLALLQPADPTQDRPGALGALVDVQQNLLLFVVMGGFLAGSILAIYVGIERIFPRHTWSLGPLNHVRTALWLPQDYDEALCRAAAAGDLGGVEWLAQHGARPNVFCGDGAAVPDIRSADAATPRIAPAQLSRSLLQAAQAGELEVVRDLLAKGADPDLVVEGEPPVLQFAVMNKEDALIQILLDAGADPDLLLPGGLTITDDLADLDQADKALPYLRLMAAHGADLNHRDARGWTFLMRECADPGYSTRDFVVLLLELGAEPNLTAADGRTALDFAQATGGEELVAALQAKGARSGRLGEDRGATPLDEQAPAAQAALAFLQHLIARDPGQWQPDADSQGLTAYGANVFRLALPSADVTVRGFADKERASATVCGSGGKEGPSCMGLELRYRAVQGTAESPVEGDAPAHAWQVVSYWRDRSTPSG